MGDNPSCGGRGQVTTMDKVMPVVGGLIGLWATTKIVPVMYRWELVPGVGSPEYQAKAKTINYNHYRDGIMYDSYDTGEMTTEIPPACLGKMYLKSKQGGWKFASEM